MRLQRGPIPLYYQIAQVLRSQIRSREYKPKDMLPTEEEMVRTIGVSRTTVRQALQMLLHEGLIERTPGKGTFVAPEHASLCGDWSVHSIQGFIDAGHVTKVKFLDSQNLPAGEGLAKILHIPPASLVTQFSKLDFANDEPFMHVTINLPYDLAARIPVQRIEEKPVFSLIEEYCNLRILEAHQWIAASLAGGEIARHLRLTPADPILLIERHFVDANGRVVQVSTDRCRTDRMRHYLRLTRTGGAMSSALLPP